MNSFISGSYISSDHFGNSPTTNALVDNGQVSFKINVLLSLNSEDTYSLRLNDIGKIGPIQSVIPLSKQHGIPQNKNRFEIHRTISIELNNIDKDFIFNMEIKLFNETTENIESTAEVKALIQVINNG